MDWSTLNAADDLLPDFLRKAPSLPNLMAETNPIPAKSSV